MWISLALYIALIHFEWRRDVNEWKSMTQSSKCQALATPTIIIMSVIKLSLFWSPNREITNYSEINNSPREPFMFHAFILLTSSVIVFIRFFFFLMQTHISGYQMTNTNSF